MDKSAISDSGLAKQHRYEWYRLLAIFSWKTGEYATIFSPSVGGSSSRLTNIIVRKVMKGLTILAEHVFTL